MNIKINNKPRIRKITYHSLLCWLLLLFPAVDIMVCYFSNGDNMNFLAFVYVILLIIVCYRMYGNSLLHIKRKFLLLIIDGLLVILISFLREPEFAQSVISMLYVATLLFLYVFAENKFHADFLKKFIKENRNKYYIVQLIYYFFIFIYFKQNGLVIGYGTQVFQGPYNLPHTMAYLLTGLFVIDIYLFLAEKSYIGIAFALSATAIVLTTGVRVVLIPIAIVGVFLVTRLVERSYYSRLMIVAIIAAIGIYIIYRYGLLTTLIEKTNVSLKYQHSISNARGRIYMGSIKSYVIDETNWIIKLVAGIGLNALEQGNIVYAKGPIQAHNDFLNVFICYGFINGIIYSYYFLKFNRKHTGWFLLSVGVLAFGNGLFPYTEMVPLIIYFRLLFDIPANRRIGQLK